MVTVMHGNSLFIYFHHILRYLLLALFLACNNSVYDDEQQSKEVYLPPISAYVFVDEMPDKLAYKCSLIFENCDPNGERFASPADMVAAIFGNSEGTSNYFTKQLNVANQYNVNDLEIYYVKTDSNIISTATFKGLDKQSFTLTDIDGFENRGTVNHAAGRIRIIFVGSFLCDGVSAGGCAYLGNVASMQNPEIGLVVINSNYQTLRLLSETVAHELGHFFGLLHTFESVPTPGCSTVSEGTTNYLMDYNTNPTVFQECEISYAKTLLEASSFPTGLFHSTTAAFANDDSIGAKPGELNLARRQKEPRVKVFRGDWEGQITINKEPNADLPDYDLRIMP